MKTLAYLDCPTGISGDMCLGALVNAGVPVEYLKQQLAQLGLEDEFNLRAETVLRNQQAATKVFVDLLKSADTSSHNGHQQDSQAHEGHTHEGYTHKHHSHKHHSHKHHGHEGHTHEGHVHEDHTHESHAHGHSHHSRRLPEIESIIQRAGLSKRSTRWSLAVFRQLAAAEASVHGIPPEAVHFHEVGATDAIVDIVGTCLGLDWLDIDGLICSPLPTGGGTVRCDHGLLGVPVPAVLSMMASAQMPVYSNGIDRELVTPTGCAIAATLAQSFGPPPSFTLQKIGLGAGGRDLPLPNILRLWIGTAQTLPSAVQKSKAHPKGEMRSQEMRLKEMRPKIEENITELQTQLDDCSPQAIGYIFDALFAAGALDVFSQPVAMKKNRLGTLVTVLCAEARAAACEAILFSETTTLGIRRTQQRRSVLWREIVPLQTPFGTVPVKVARLQAAGKVVNIHPEYEDCARLARSHKVPWQQIHQAALAVATQKFQV
ncbi:MAG: nickel pincer cofactor biosynthesis protein LarC [Cyanobacteria bacterium J06623_5]